ncbi:MAG: protein-export chaperone SecB [Gammaproteobacteria bacterium]|nr:protein-export chaperone SecB [Gammaproteobacteria bacterium]
MTTPIAGQKTQGEQSQPEFVIQRIYVKDLSFEVPGAPQIFQTEWNPQVDINLDTTNEKIADDVYDIVLKVTVTVKLKDKTAFLIEAVQGGIFTLKGFTAEQLGPMLGSYCPTILYPYARELISETVNRGSFPPLYLAPINFDALYLQKQQQEKKN